MGHETLAAHVDLIMQQRLDLYSVGRSILTGCTACMYTLARYRLHRPVPRMLIREVGFSILWTLINLAWPPNWPFLYGEKNEKYTINNAFWQHIFTQNFGQTSNIRLRILNFGSRLLDSGFRLETTDLGLRTDF